MHSLVAECRQQAPARLRLKAQMKRTRPPVCAAPPAPDSPEGAQASNQGGERGPQPEMVLAVSDLRDCANLIAEQRPRLADAAGRHQEPVLKSPCVQAAEPKWNLRIRSSYSF